MCDDINIRRFRYDSIKRKSVQQTENIVLKLIEEIVNHKVTSWTIQKCNDPKKNNTI